MFQSIIYLFALYFFRNLILNLNFIVFSLFFTKTQKNPIEKSRSKKSKISSIFYKHSYKIVQRDVLAVWKAAHKCLHWKSK